MRFQFKNVNYTFDDPTSCPHCHNGIQPVHIGNYPGGGPKRSEICYSLWRCPHRECGSMFVSVFEILGNGQGNFRGFLDGSPIGPHWPDSIKKLDSRFMTTYIQSLQAEYHGLNEISGMGYRKAIEYLVKDYLINNDENLKGKIEDAMLSKVIVDNFKDSREIDLKDLLQRATWLGNDMTHYLKYHKNFDINDLKALIKLVMDEIHSIEQKRHYITAIQSKYEKEKTATKK